VAPCGAGKTVIASEIARSASERGRSVLWLTHTQELVDQSTARVPWAAVRSIQSLLGGDRPTADVVILDEAHHFVAPIWNEVARDYSQAIVVGLTATPERADGVALGDLFTALVVAAQTPDLSRAGYLVSADVWAPSKRLRGSVVDPIESWHARAASLRTIVYCTTVERARELAQCWPSAGAACVDGETKADVRRDRVESFAAGACQVLTNCHVLTEGVDVPAIECIVLARGFSSQGSYLQAVGRALRPSPGKQRALILDLCGSVWEHGLPDEAREYSLAGKAIRSVERLEPIRQCRRCGAVFAEPGTTCPRCGATVSRPLTREQHIARRETLQRVNDAQPESRKAEVFAQLQATARERGYKPGWAAVQFKARYGHWPRRHAA
jgi:DNA repair protein RadD